MAIVRLILCEEKLILYYVIGGTQEIITMSHQRGYNGMMTKILRKTSKTKIKKIQILKKDIICILYQWGYTGMMIE